MIRRGLLLLWLTACGTGSGALRPESEGVRAWVEAQRDDGGVLVVQVAVPADVDVELPEPEARGLTLQADGEARVERVGARVVITQRYHFSGEPGIYEVPALVARYTGPEGEGRVRSSPLWVDLGTEPPRPDVLADIDEPATVWQPPAAWQIAAVLGVGLLGVGGLAAIAWAFRPVPVAPRVISPYERALAAWESARRDAGLSEHDLALAVSRIFREYLDEALRFPATAWSTTETLAHLEAMAFLPEGNVPRARRLLRATDRVKFADAQARAELFEELDADLRAFLDSTRPRSWQVEEAQA